MSILLFATLAGLIVLKYLSLHSSFFDLGIFTGIFYKLSHFGEWWRLFGGHAQPLMPIYAAVYKVLPENFAPLGVIILQAFFLTLPGFWILKRYGRLPFLLLALYFPLWFNALFDFHMDHLAVPLLFWFYFLVEDGRYKAAILPAILLALVKEPFALQTAACGVWFVVRGLWFVVNNSWINSSWMVVSNWRKNKPLTTNHKQPTNNDKLPTIKYHQIIIGFFLISFGLSYFYLLVSYVFPVLTGKKGYLSNASFFWMGSGFKEIIYFILTHPLTILKEIFETPGKIFYLVAVFGPFLFISFLAPLYLIPAVPILAISLLSHNPNHYGYAHHYTAGLIAPIFMSFIKGLPRAEKLVGRFLSKTPKLLTFFHRPPSTNNQLQTTQYKLLTTILIVSLLFHVMFSPSPISRLFWTNKVWNYGYEAYIPTNRDKMIKQAIKKYIPSDPKVAVATQNTLNWGYLAHRKYYFAFPTGVIEPALIPNFNTSLWEIFSSFWQHKSHHNQPPSINYQPVYAQYVLIDIKRPWYVNDQGCNWQTGKPLVLTKEEIEKIGLKKDPGPLKWAGCAEIMDIKWESPSGKTYKGNLRKLFIEFLHKTLDNYQKIYENDGFLILKRIEQ